MSADIPSVPPPREFQISVRELAQFVHQAGDLAGESMFRASNRAVEGTRGHQRLQKSRGDDYQAEIALQRSFEKEGVRLTISGRVDGLIEGETPLVEEFKTVDSRWAGRADPVHFAQLRLYAGMFVIEKEWPQVAMNLTYLDLGTDDTTIFREEKSREELLRFLNDTVEAWFSWLIPHARRLEARDISINALAFPFGQFREGQRTLATSVYRTVRDGGRLFVEAPTGLGKTAATLFPAVKMLPLFEGQIFFVTAKTPGRLAAEQAMEHLRNSGLRALSLTLTAKQKICFSETPAGCDPRTCPFAVGYYDRSGPAVRELLQHETINRAAVETVARAHNVCPHELSLDASRWTDVVIGDYNHVFDPVSRLQRHFAEGKPRHVVLVDEAHNLVDRSRDMYSATLFLQDLEVARGAPGGAGSGKARRGLARLHDELEALIQGNFDGEGVIPHRPYHEGAVVLDKVNDGIVEQLRNANRAMEGFMAEQRPGLDLSAWLNPWFAILGFLRAVDSFDDGCKVIIRPSEGSITVFCADPSARLMETLEGFRSTIFFSATLSPLDYFRELLGGKMEDPVLRCPSPFNSDQMHLRILDQDVTFRGRARSLRDVANEIVRHISETPGNHLVFCPSMDYLSTLRDDLAAVAPHLNPFSQSIAMKEEDRSAFLERFVPGASVTGLAVLGGIFAEGIDLAGDRLKGVTVIGVGLPRLSVERDILQAHFTALGKNGFDYAYRLPGMQRVLQAVGRLIRSEQDTGAALLIDRRFLERRYRVLFPSWWGIA